MTKVIEEGPRKKKKFGQNFLRASWVLDKILDKANLSDKDSVFEIGCGDGFLTRAILGPKIKRLWSFEIDPEWADHVKNYIKDERLSVLEMDFLEFDLEKLKEHEPWVLLANLPYNITFPILEILQKNRHLLSRGVIMVQEEVAQKITKKSGKGFGFTSLFFQHFFKWEVLDKVPPTDFVPQPKVFSRLLYFEPRKDVRKIQDEAGFWDFIKVCFKQPRRTLRNNLAQSSFDLSKIPENILSFRAQQVPMDDLVSLWEKIR